MTDPAGLILERRDGWLLVSAEGPRDIAWLLDSMRSVAATAIQERSRAVLLDVRGVELTFTFADRLRAGSVAAESFDGCPVAMVVAETIIDPQRIGESVARNQGLDGRLFTDRTEAEEWLSARVAARAGWGG